MGPGAGGQHTVTEGTRGTRHDGMEWDGAERTEHSQTQLFGRFLLVMTRTLPAERAIGMAQQTTRGVDRPLLLMVNAGVAYVVLVVVAAMVVSGMELGAGQQVRRLLPASCTGRVRKAWCVCVSRSGKEWTGAEGCLLCETRSLTSTANRLATSKGHVMGSVGVRAVLQRERRADRVWRRVELWQEGRILCAIVRRCEERRCKPLLEGVGRRRKKRIGGGFAQGEAEPGPRKVWRVENVPGLT